MYEYTLGFVKCKNEILLLNRENPGWMGCFNGIGGRIEEGETPFEGIKRELLEETNIISDKIKLCGYVSWEKFNHLSGAYIFVIEIDEKPFDGPVEFDEGLLVWKDVAWITHPENRGIAKNVLPYIKKLFKNEKQLHFKTSWENNQFVGVEIIETSEKVEYDKVYKITPVDYKTVALKKLSKCMYQNSNAMYFLKNDLYKEVRVVGNSVVMRLLNDGVFIYWDRKISFSFIEEVLRDTDYKFYMIDKRVKDELSKTRKQKYLSLSTQFYLENYEVVEPSYAVEPIRLESIGYILENMHYKLGYSEELLADRISSGYSSAVYEDGLLIAWVYQHDDGSVGGLNVIPSHRHKGYAKAVCYDILNNIMSQNDYAICQIESTNQASFNLFKSFGFVKSHEIVWVGYEKSKNN